MSDDAPAEFLQASSELEAEFERALRYRLTDEDLEHNELKAQGAQPADVRSQR
jgi:hypothetical protein